jgi:AraC-like DNA-binding protein
VLKSKKKEADMKNSIIKNDLYISAFDRVFKSYISPQSIPLSMPRKSDGFIYILGGSCRYSFTDGRICYAKPGDILYLAKDSQYEMEVIEKYDFICVNFFFYDSMPRESDVFSTKDTQETENIFYKILRKAADESHVSDIMSMLYRIYYLAVRSRTPVYLSSDLRSKIEKSKATIISDFNDPDLSVSRLAADAKMSEPYFRSRFRDICGVSPVKYITDRRLAHAKELLEMDFLSLYDIAKRCGFSTTSYFCRVFKSNVGITATEYKKKTLQ